MLEPEHEPSKDPNQIDAEEKKDDPEDQYNVEEEMEVHMDG